MNVPSQEFPILMDQSLNANNYPLVSVITPVYNTEKYLAECIQSVLRQTYSNWEYIILNNKSTDRSLEIAESYAKSDSRIRVITNQQHLTLMENLNLAFRYIADDSKYCKVIHADDWLFPDCLNQMIEVAESNPSVGIVGAYRLAETKVGCDGLPFPSFCSDGREIARNHLFWKMYLFGSPSTLLLRSDLIRKRDKVYDESTIHGDVLACLDFLREADFGFVHQVLTFTRRHNESAFGLVRSYQTGYYVQMLQSIVLYGRFFLSDDEYNKRLRDHLWDYHRLLARKLMQRKGRDFFRFHKNELNKLGLQVSYLKLLSAAVWEGLNFRDVIKHYFDRAGKH
jgi:glycosyltransferase involved in cell wall biosynthesis